MDRMENYQIGHTPAKGEEFKIERNVCHDAHVEVAFSHRHTFMRSTGSIGRGGGNT